MQSQSMYTQSPVQKMAKSSPNSSITRKMNITSTRPGVIKPMTTAKPKNLKVAMIDLTKLGPKNKNFNSTLNSAKSK